MKTNYWRVALAYLSTILGKLNRLHIQLIRGQSSRKSSSSLCRKYLTPEESGGAISLNVPQASLSSCRRRDCSCILLEIKQAKLHLRTVSFRVAVGYPMSCKCACAPIALHECCISCHLIGAHGPSACLTYIENTSV